MFNLLIVENTRKQALVQQILSTHKDNWLILSIRDYEIQFHNPGYSELFSEPFLDGANNHIIDSILGLAEEVDNIYVGTDPDQIGESIAWSISRRLLQRFIKKPIFRVRYNKITKDSLFNALNSPGNFDWKANESQTTRKLVDLATDRSYNSILQKVFKCRKLSVVNMQPVVLKMIIENWRHRSGFKPSSLYRIIGKLSDGTAIASEIFKTKKEANYILSNIEKVKLVYENSKKEIIPPPPFNTSSLLQCASSRLGIPSDTTTKILKILYLTGMISFMNTTSIFIGRKSVDKIKSYIEEILPGYASKENTQKEHGHGHGYEEAIYPTNIKKYPSEFDSSSDAKELYKLIWTRTLVSQALPLRIINHSVYGILNSKKILFAHGGELVFDGWLKPSMGEFGSFPVPINKKAALEKESFFITENKTKPEPCFTEASLISKIESEGIGKPRAYNTILECLKQSGCIHDDTTNGIKPTDKGIVLFSFLETYIKHVTELKTLVDLEENLLKIEDGLLLKGQVLPKIFKSLNKKKKSLRGITNVYTANNTCKICGTQLALRLKQKSSMPYLQCVECLFILEYSKRNSVNVN